jgi:hypothetical protein
MPRLATYSTNKGNQLTIGYPPDDTRILVQPQMARASDGGDDDHSPSQTQECLPTSFRAQLKRVA